MDVSRKQVKADGGNENAAIERNCISGSCIIPGRYLSDRLLRVQLPSIPGRIRPEPGRQKIDEATQFGRRMLTLRMNRVSAEFRNRIFRQDRHKTTGLDIFADDISRALHHAGAEQRRRPQSRVLPTRIAPGPGWRSEHHQAPQNAIPPYSSENQCIADSGDDAVLPGARAHRAAPDNPAKHRSRSGRASGGARSMSNPANDLQ